MNNQHDFNWFFDRDYCGRILRGDFSNSLKQHIAGSINRFRNFSTSENPTTPYIAAWYENNDKDIWYEFIGNRLLELFRCQSCEAAEIFRECIIQRCTFDYQSTCGKISRSTLTNSDLPRLRNQLRNEIQRKGESRAVYKLELKDSKTIWLQDQAKVQLFPEDRVCISYGALMDITPEMAAEEQLIEQEKKLRQKQEHLEKKLIEQNRELWKTQLEIIYTLAQAAKCRDKHAGLHITKMSHYCDVLSKAAELNGEWSELLFHATAMHDVGKIGISEAILQKPGKLSQQEFEIMKTHSIIGAKLLSGNDSALLKIAKSVALTHHERWDGSGYPNGLKGDEIPLEGRITSICDVFDALTSERPYKKAWPANEAFEEVKRGRGTRFDPQLVDCFLNHKSRLVDIQNRYTHNREC